MISKDSVRTPKFLLQRIQKEYFNSGVMFDPTPFVPVFDPKKHTDGLKITWEKRQSKFHILKFMVCVNTL